MFSSKVREKLKNYVYLCVDPRDGQPFYVGKGMGNRLFSHLKDKSESAKVQRIEELRKLGLEPQLEILKYGLSEEDALLVEATAIDLLRVGSLTNAVRGHGCRYGGRATVEELEATLGASPVDIKEPAVLININQAYHYGLTAQQLYDFTRSCWRIGAKRETVEYAFAVYQGVIREVYKIAAWVPGRSTMRHDDVVSEDKVDPKNRWEFVGKVADPKMRKRYVGMSVSHYSKQGAQNPIKYVNC